MDKEKVYDERVAFGAILLERVKPGCLCAIDLSALNFGFFAGADIVSLALGMDWKSAITRMEDFCPELSRPGVASWQFGFRTCCDDTGESEALKQAWTRFVGRWRAVTMPEVEESTTDV